eukprot:113358_1
MPVLNLTNIRNEMYDSETYSVDDIERTWRETRSTSRSSNMDSLATNSSDTYERLDMQLLDPSTSNPTLTPTMKPVTKSPTFKPTSPPTQKPTLKPTLEPTLKPT